MPRPRGEITIPVQAWLRPEQVEQLDEEAKRLGITRAELFRRIVDGYFKKPSR
jgi:hypothetical protein